MLDLRNAFNSLSRTAMATAISQHAPKMLRVARWVYGQPSPLLVVDRRRGQVEVLSSEQGVRQGDPLGPFFFSVGFRPRIEALCQLLQLPVGSLMAYLDDITILSKHGDIMEELHRSFDRLVPDAMVLNREKSVHVTFDHVRTNGLQVLGSCIGPMSARRSFLLQKIETGERKLEQLREAQLPRQAALLMLRLSISADIRHLLRCLDSTGLHQLWERWDTALYNFLRSLRNSHSDGAHDRLLFSLPLSFGGCGISSHADSSTLARSASREAAEPVIDCVSTGVPLQARSANQPPPLLSQRRRQLAVVEAQLEATLPTMCIKQRLSVADNGGPAAYAWMTAYPRDKQSTLTDEQVSAGLHARTLHPGAGPLCRNCSSTNVLGHDLVCTAVPSLRTKRHEVVKNAVFSAGRAVKGATGRVEPVVASASANSPGLRADFELTGPASPNGTAGLFDVTVAGVTTDSFVGKVEHLVRRDGESWNEFGNRQLTEGLQQLAKGKVDKYAAYIQSGGVQFYPLVATAGGSLDDNFLSLLSAFKTADLDVSRLRRVLSIRLLRIRAAGFCF